MEDKKVPLLDGNNRFWNGKLLLQYVNDSVAECFPSHLEPVTMDFSSLKQFFQLLEGALSTCFSLDAVETILSRKPTPTSEGTVK